MEERREGYIELQSDVEDLKEDMKKVKPLVEEMHRALVGTLEENHIGILPRLRSVESFMRTYRYIILSVVATLVSAIISKVLGVW